MVEHFEYVDTAGNQSINAHKTANLVGQLVRHYDPSGLVETLRLDFSGNVLEVQRRLNNQPHDSLIDWPTINPDSLLVTETFVQITEYDALKRMTKHYNWHRDITFAPDGTQQSTPGKTNRVAVYLPEYNQRGALASEWLHVRASKATDANGQVSFTADAQRSQQAIQEIRYNAKGQKELLKLGNGTITRYDYDEKTFRLRQLRTTRPTYAPSFPQYRSDLKDTKVLQQLLYTYDPVGNITEIIDEAYKPAFFQNALIEPRSLYEYDALYRLIKASGRENGAATGAPQQIEGAAEIGSFPVTAANALRKYEQDYQYDPVGNIKKMHHSAGLGTWTRNYQYALDSNRLTGTDTDNPSKAIAYRYDAHGNMLNLANVPDEYRMQWDHRDMIRSINLIGGGTAYYQYDTGKQRTRKRIENQNGLGGYWERIYLGGYERYRRYNGNGSTAVEEIESHHLFEGEQRVLLVDDVIKTNRKHVNNTAYKEEPIYRYQYSNHLGSACLELDDSAEIISYEEYHPYGTSAYRVMKSGIEAPANRYRYTGMERDEESGLGYHGARYYLPWLGRWVNSDPGGMVDGENLYLYARDNPDSFIDTTGNEADINRSHAQSDFEPLVIEAPVKRWEASDEEGLVAEAPVKGWEASDVEGLMTEAQVKGWEASDEEGLITEAPVKGWEASDEEGLITEAPVKGWEASDEEGLVSEVIIDKSPQWAKDLDQILTFLTGTSPVPLEITASPDPATVSSGGTPDDGANWLSNVRTAYAMTLMWQTGYRMPFGVGSHYENDEVANAIRNAHGVDQARDYFYKKYKGAASLKGASVTNYGASFGLSGLARAGIDPIEQFIGSYTINMSVVNGNWLQYSITNNTSFTSFFYGIGPSWNGGPMGNFNQTYIFTEPINLNRLRANSTRRQSPFIIFQK